MNKTLKITLIVIALVIVVSLIIWAMLNITSNKEKSEQDQTANQPTQTTSAQIPTAHQISGVSYYGEQGGFCYGSSAMMILEKYGFSKDEVEKFKTIVKNQGQGGPPDIFIGFSDDSFDLADKVYLGYSKNYNKETKDFYDNFLDNPEKQVVLFANENEALKKLKQLVSQNIPVIALIDNGNHYVVVTGYDDKTISYNDPDISSEQQKKIAVEDFISEWNISGEDKSISGKMGFPGDYGLIWLEK